MSKSCGGTCYLSIRYYIRYEPRGEQLRSEVGPALPEGAGEAALHKRFHSTPAPALRLVGGRGPGKWGDPGKRPESDGYLSQASGKRVLRSMAAKRVHRGRPNATAEPRPAASAQNTKPTTDL